MGSFKESEGKVSGKTRTGSATGEKSEFSSIYQRLRDLKVIGKTQRRNADLTEFTFCLTKKTPDSSQEDSNKPILIEFMQILSLNTTITLRICPLIKFLKSITTKLIEC